MSELEPDFGIVGYTDRWSYRPGNSVTLHLSAEHECTAAVRLHRFSGFEQDGVGLDAKAECIPAVAANVVVSQQSTLIGSWFEVPDNGRLSTGEAFTLGFFLKPTYFSRRANIIAGQANDKSGFVLCVSREGILSLKCRSAEGKSASIELQTHLVLGQWIGVVVSYDASQRQLTLALCQNGQLHVSRIDVDFDFRLLSCPLYLANCPNSFLAPMASLNGRIEAPAFWTSAIPPKVAFADLEKHADGTWPQNDALRAAWDFSRSIDSAVNTDVGPHAIEGHFRNLPTRAVKGYRWRGTEQSWRYAPRDYASVHFHEDDLIDANWPASTTITLPSDLASGCYLIEVSGSAGRDVMPIFVTALERGKTSKLAVLIPTFSYLAYANDHCLLHGSNPEMIASRLLSLTTVDCTLASRPEYGLSLYDTHIDGSGVSYASRRRPCLTLRHSQRAWQAGIGSGLWNFGADLLELSWLERSGIAYELVTDDELDTEGESVLANYRCVITGSHPEYHTDRTLDIVADYLAHGGRFIYLGGNGFYWRVSTHSAYPETIELRRAEDGNRSWAAEPGEYYHAFDGAYGGLWRRNGRPPQALVGVGYTAQGFLKSHPYRLLSASKDPRASFLFEGVPANIETIGTFGLIGGGAAGIEIDRADAALGTPHHTLVLATADQLDDTYLLASEEILTNRPNVVGDLSPLIRADLTFFETPSGGAVLSTGSIAWVGSAGDQRTPNEIARITENAIRRFLDPTPFSLPGAAPV